MLQGWLERRKLQHCIPGRRLCAVQLTEQQSAARYIGWSDEAPAHSGAFRSKNEINCLNTVHGVINILSVRSMLALSKGFQMSTSVLKVIRTRFA